MFNHGTRQELLEWLRDCVGASYVSDLAHCRDFNNRALLVMRNTDFKYFTLKAINDCAEYLLPFRIVFKTKRSAKKYFKNRGV